MDAGRVSSSSRNVGQNIGEMIVVSSKASLASARQQGVMEGREREREREAQSTRPHLGLLSTVLSG
jgi:hypothetical protein